MIIAATLVALLVSAMARASGIAECACLAHNSINRVLANRSRERVSEVRFAMTIDNQPLEIVDSGAFDPNVEIEHRFRRFPGVGVMKPLAEAEPSVTCSVKGSR